MKVTFQPRFEQDEVEPLLNRYNGVAEEPIKKMVLMVQSRGFLTKSELAIVGNWKSHRIRSRIQQNSEKDVQEVTKVALGTSLIKLCIHVPQLLYGVGMPVASTLLHWFHRDPFPILDFRALWSLGIDPPPAYTLSFWEEYVEATRSISESWQVDKRTLDRALWQYSYENQPPRK